MKLLKMAFLFFLCGVSVFSQTYLPNDTESAKKVAKIEFTKAVSIDDAYKTSFDKCDKDTTKNGCKNDPNRLRKLARFGDQAIFFDSKMSLDLDGSYVACNCQNSIGKSDQCSTSYTWKGFPKEYDKNYPEKFCPFYKNDYFVDSNKIPFIVIPGGFGNHFQIKKKPHGKEFIGDLGIVVYKGILIPVFVADSGPSFRIGEGSAALFGKLGEDGCHKYDGEQCVSFEEGDYSIDKDVLYFIFPSSKIDKKTLNKDNAAELIKEMAMKKFAEFEKSFEK
jgi:hypothetical protein